MSSFFFFVSSFLINGCLWVNVYKMESDLQQSEKRSSLSGGAVCEVSSRSIWVVHILSKMDLSLATAWPSLPVCPPLSLPLGPARAPLRSTLGPPGVPAPRALGFHKSMPFSFSWGSPSVSCFPFSGKHSPPGTESCASLGVSQLST